MNRLLCRYGLVLLLSLAVLCPRIFAAEDAVVIVTNPEVTDSLNKDEIKQIFLGKKTQWKDNSSIIFILPDNDQLLIDFLKTFIGKSPEQFENYWKKQVFTGKGKMPKVIRTTAELTAFVAENKGTITFMSREDVDDTQVNILSFQP